MCHFASLTCVPGGVPDLAKCMTGPLFLFVYVGRATSAGQGGKYKVLGDGDI